MEIVKGDVDMECKVCANGDDVYEDVVSGQIGLKMNQSTYRYVDLVLR